MTPKEEYELAKRVAEAEGMKVRRRRGQVYVGFPGGEYWELDSERPWTGSEFSWGILNRAVSDLRGNRLFKEKFSLYVGLGRDGAELVLAAKGF